MLALRTRITGLAAASALLVTPMAASAAGTGGSSGTAAAAQQAPPQTPWLTLSMLSPSGTIGLGGAAAQAGASESPPPPPPPNGYDNSHPPYPVIGLWLAEFAVAVYLLTKNHHGHVSFPNSPG